MGRGYIGNCNPETDERHVCLGLGTCCKQESKTQGGCCRRP